MLGSGLYGDWRPGAGCKRGLLLLTRHGVVARFGSCSVLGSLSCGADVGRGEQACGAVRDWRGCWEVADDVDGVTEDAGIVVPGADGELNEARGSGG